MSTPIAKQITGYFRGALAEFKKVTWPTRAQTRAYTIAVVALSAGTAIFFSVLDGFFSKIIESLL